MVCIGVFPQAAFAGLTSVFWQAGLAANPMPAAAYKSHASS